MSSPVNTEFESGTVIASAWLNGVNDHVVGIESDTGATLVGFLPSGTNAVAVTVDDVLQRTVNITNYATIQDALNTGADVVVGNAGTYNITDSLVINTVGQHLKLDPNCIINLNTADTTKKVVDVQAANAYVSGGQLTTNLRTLNFLVRLAGENSKLVGSQLYYATKSTIAPIGGTNDIPYNRGGVEVRGNGSEVLGCNIYNQEGAGVVSYVDKVSIKNNKIHDNVLGVHATIQAGETTSRTVAIVDNIIYDNNVNHASGAVGILASQYCNVIVTGNRITGNGEHGTYIYSEKSTISNNYVSGNYRNGLKVRAAREVIVSNNVVVDNNTENAGTSGSIVIQSQLSAGLDPENNKVIVSGNISNGSNCVGIITSIIDAGYVVKNLVITDNITNSMQIAATSDVIISNNIVSGSLDAGAAFANAPAIQTNFKVSNNIADVISMNRCADSYFETNTIRTLTSGTQRNNVIKGNNITAQATQISRTAFSAFIENTVNCSSLGAVPLLLHAGLPADNSFKRIQNNSFIAHASRVLDDSSSTVSGSKNVISGNVFDSATQGISIWGDGHTIMGNTNISTGGVGFVGCNNSWLIGNSPVITLRGGTVGNVLL